jgi:hypothetical protein
MIHNIHDKGYNGPMKLKEPPFISVEFPGPSAQACRQIFICRGREFKRIAPNSGCRSHTHTV